MGKNIHGQNIIDGTIDSSTLDSSILDQIETYQDIQDVSILININEITQLDSSIVRLDAYNLIQDASIVASSYIPIIEMTDTNISIDSSWNNYFIKLDPTGDASVSFNTTTEGVNLTFENESANTIYFYSGTGAPVLKSKDSAVTLASQYGMVTCIHDGSSWYLSGDTE